MKFRQAASENRAAAHADLLSFENFIFPPQALTNNNKLLYLWLLRFEVYVDLRVADVEDVVAVGLAAWGRRRRGFGDDLALLWGSTSIE